MASRLLWLAWLFALPVFAQDPKGIDPALADRAVAKLRPGAWCMEWDSAGESTPRLVLILGAAVVEVEGRRAAQVILDRVTLGTSRPAKDTPFRWAFPREAQEIETGPVDLATLYVPSTEVKGMLVSLARLLDHAAPVRWPALDLPALDGEQVQKRASEVIALLAPPAQNAQELKGTLEEEGRRLLLLLDDGTTWELEAPKDRIYALLRGRDGLEATLRVVPTDDEKKLKRPATRRKGTVDKVLRVVRPPVKASEADEDDGPAAIR